MLSVKYFFLHRGVHRSQGRVFTGGYYISMHALFSNGDNFLQDPNSFFFLLHLSMHHYARQQSEFLVAKAVKQCF